MSIEQKPVTCYYPKPVIGKSYWLLVLSVLWYVAVCLMLYGCRSNRPVPSIEMQEQPSTTTVVPNPTIALHPTDTGWNNAALGIEIRHVQIVHHTRLVPVVIIRIDPQHVRFRVLYQPDQPRMMADWCSQSGVLAAINGGFFDKDNRSTALVMSDGIASGTSYEGVGGMFAVDTAGNVSLRYLGTQPYLADEPIVEALQGWPMLIKPSDQLAYEDPEDTRTARRSVLAMDGNGRVLMIVFPTSTFSLHQLPPWLLNSDLDIDTALNLDGGSSTGMCFNIPGYQEIIDSFGPLPMVLVVE